MKKLILFVFILILPFQVQAGRLWSVTGGVDTLRTFDLSLLPRINSDLKVCDELKRQFSALKVDYLISNENNKALKVQLKQEKRKRIIGNVIRTAIEVGAILVLLKL